MPSFTAIYLLMGLFTIYPLLSKDEHINEIYRINKGYEYGAAGVYLMAIGFLFVVLLWPTIFAIIVIKSILRWIKRII